MLSSFSADSSNVELEEFKRILHDENKWLDSVASGIKPQTLTENALPARQLNNMGKDKSAR